MQNDELLAHNLKVRIEYRDNDGGKQHCQRITSNFTQWFFNSVKRLIYRKK